MDKTYRDVEAKRGKNSFDAIRTAVFRGKACDLRRHFCKGTLLREMVSRSDMLAKNDKTGRRFIFETKWTSLLALGYSQSAIDRAERICEGSAILTPARGVVKGKALNGWIVIDHDKCRTLIDNGESCQLDITLNSNPPRRGRGERRWKTPEVSPSPFRGAEQKSVPDSLGIDESPLVSPFPSAESPFQSPLVSPFQSPFPENSESISLPATSLQTQGLPETGERKPPPNPVNSANSGNLERENPVNPAQARDPKPTPSPSFSETKPKPNGQGKSPADTLVLELACIADDVCGLFHKPQQQAVAELLAKHSGEEIKELWREHWNERKNNTVRKRFAVEDFLKTADRKLAARVPELACTENG